MMAQAQRVWWAVLCLQPLAHPEAAAARRLQICCHQQAKLVYMIDRPSTCNASVRNAVRAVILALMLLHQWPCSKRESPLLSNNINDPPRTRKPGHNIYTNHTNKTIFCHSRQCQTPRMLCCLQMALKCADLGHLAAPWAVHQRWVAGLEEELFRQGDSEKQLHMLVSPLMDRTKGGITKSQVSQMDIRCAGQASQCLKAAGRQCVVFSIIVHNAGQTDMFRTYRALHFQNTQCTQSTSSKVNITSRLSLPTRCSKSIHRLQVSVRRPV